MRRTSATAKNAAFCGAIVALALAIVFAPYLFGGQSLLSSSQEAPSVYRFGATPDHQLQRLHTLDPGAPAWQSEPWLALEHRLIFDEHRMPLWDPYDGYGVPFLAAMLPQPFYPLTLAVSAQPSPTAYNWFIVARLFLAGWFAALFVLFFVDRYAAVCTGIGTCLTGYYLLNYNITHLSVDTAFPLLLWATELVLRRQSPLRCVATIVAASIVYLGGMPETAFLIFVVCTGYAIVRIASMDGARRRPLLAFLGTYGTAILVAGIMLVPFAEFERLSYNIHDPVNTGGALVGLQYDADWQTRPLTELLPMVYGYFSLSILNGAGFTGTRGFFGCTILFLALLAVVSVQRNRKTAGIVVFFAAVATYCILKRYGSPVVQWTGTLPFFDLIGMPKYLEFILGDSMAILAGFGVAAITSRAASTRSVVISSAAVLAVLTALYTVTRPLIPAEPSAVTHYPVAFIIGLATFTAAGIIAYNLLLPRRHEPPRWLAMSFGCLVFAELTTGYAAPNLWTLTGSIALNPFAGAPFLRYLDDHVLRSQERIFAVEGALFPNWPGAYGFADPRSLNAVYPAAYFPFVRAFLGTGVEGERFTGSQPFDIGTPLVDRWLHLSSIGWLVAPEPLANINEPPGGFLGPLWRQVKPTLPPNVPVAVEAISIHGVQENVLFEHPPFDGVRYTTAVPRDRPIVRADIGIDPSTYAHTPVCGGPVTFTIHAIKDGRVVGTAAETIDPKHIVSERHWIPMLLDLAPFAARDVTLQFGTSATDFCSAWAVWGGPRFARRGDRAEPTVATPQNPETFGSPDAHLYRITGSYPRIRLLHRATVMPSLPDMLARMTAPNFDAAGEAVVDRPIGALIDQSRGDRISVVSERSDEVTVDVNASVTSLLLQNDTYYPGWEATIDGSHSTIVRADYLFRGVVVPPGRHVVTIAYRSHAVALGEIMSGTGLLLTLCLTMWGLAQHLRSRGRTEAQQQVFTAT